MDDLTMRDVALRYLAGGWCPIELPPGAKWPPPEGRTGALGVDMTAIEVELAPWAGNIGTRMPLGVMALDVDAYHGGLDTLRELIERLGPLPLTIISHSGRDDGSGIRFYAVPVGLHWIAGMPGIEVIQRHHRYAVLFPSTHPDGRRYALWSQIEEGPIDELPPVDDLPELPWPWIEALSRASQADVDSGAPAQAATFEAVQSFIAQADRGDAPSYLSTIVDYFRERRTAGFSRHDSMQHALAWAMECARAGVITAADAVTRLADAWQGAVADDPRRAAVYSSSRVTEFDAMLRWAVGKVETKDEASIVKLHDDIAGVPMNVAPPPSANGAPEPEQATLQPDPPGIWIDWTLFVKRDVIESRWLVDGFWPWGRAMALWATAKTGKSELALWCAAHLALGLDPWSGKRTEPIDVAYFDYEMTEDDLDDRLADFDLDPLLLGRLHYALYPPLHALDTDQGGIEVMGYIEEVRAQAVVFDTFSRVVEGDENEADTVQRFFRFTGGRLKRRGIGYTRLDHAGKKEGRGPRGSSAKREDVDVAWNMKRTSSGALLDCTASSRLSWVGPLFRVDRSEATDGTITYSAPLRMGWPPGTKAKVDELDTLSVPLDTGRPAARALMKAAGITPGKNDLLTAALRFRRERAAGTAREDSLDDPPSADGGQA